MSLLSLVPGLRKVSASKGGEHAGPCPMCGGRDRFRVWPEQGEHGTWWCRGCDKGGDAIQYLREAERLSYREACTRLGITPAAPPAPEMSPATRAGSGASFTPSASTSPAAIWAEKAVAFVHHCHLALLGNKEQLAWLAGRGIDLERVNKYRLGWNAADAWRDRGAWGLPEEIKENGKPKKLWLPMGLVVPVFDADGRVCFVQTRLPEPKGDLRYLPISGGNNAPLVTRTDAEAYVVVESRLDAITLDAVAGDLAGFVAMGNDSAKPRAELATVLGRALHISVALDSDEPVLNSATGRMESPGAKASVWWIKNFPRAERTPVIGGKDPGDAFKAGVDLRAWVLATLPPRFHIKPKEENGAQDVPVIREIVVCTGHHDSDSEGAEVASGISEKNQSPNEAEKEGPLASDSRVVTLADGRSFHVVQDEAAWRKLVAQGETVFSENELKRLHAACKECGPEGGQVLASAVLDVKTVFDGSYIRRGGPAKVAA